MSVFYIRDENGKFVAVPMLKGEDVPDWAKAENPLRVFNHMPVSGVDEGRNGEVVLVIENGDSYFARCMLAGVPTWYKINTDWLKEATQFTEEGDSLRYSKHCGQIGFEQITNNDGSSGWKLYLAIEPTEYGYKWVEFPYISKGDTANDLELDEEGTLINGDKIASVECIENTLERVTDIFGAEFENKADKSYVDTIVDSVNSALNELHAYAQGIISGGDEV